MHANCTYVYSMTDVPVLTYDARPALNVSKRLSESSKSSGQLGEYSNTPGEYSDANGCLMSGLTSVYTKLPPPITAPEMNDSSPQTTMSSLVVLFLPDASTNRSSIRGGLI
jgi:hypothetical protein